MLALAKYLLPKTFCRIFIFVQEYTTGELVFSRASKVIFKSFHFLCHFTGVSLPILKSDDIFPAVSLFLVRHSLMVLLSACQFNELFCYLDPIMGLLWRKTGQVGRREGGKERRSVRLRDKL